MILAKATYYMYLRPLAKANGNECGGGQAYII